MTIQVSGEGLTIGDVVACARGHETVRLDPDALEDVREAREQLVEQIEAGDVIYGVNTGFGANADNSISDENLRTLQTNLIESHAIGVGDELREDEARAMMLLRLNSLLSGRSGIRVAVVQKLEEMLNAGVYPRVPRKGSASASGDLAPLAHMVRAMIGTGSVERDGEWVDAGTALPKVDIEPLDYLAEKEGLALINGTNYITAVGALAVHDARQLVESADVIGAMTLEGLAGITDAFDPELHELRRQPGQIQSAERIETMVHESDIATDSDDADHVQDSYSLRCMPQVHGATLDQIEQAATVIERELNAVTDNPLLLETDDGRLESISGGNFHGQPVALALDSLKTAIAELADISERRIFKLTQGDAVVPDFLVEGDEAGLNSGFMIPQVTAAALVSENKTLSHPSSVDSIPTSDNQEDHVSMGANAANHLRTVLENVTTVLAIELFGACEALEHRSGSPSGPAAEVRSLVRERVPDLSDGDRYMRDDVDELRALIDDGGVSRRAPSVDGKP